MKKLIMKTLYRPTMNKPAIMKKITSYTLPCCLLLLLLGSCSTDEHAGIAPLPPLPPEESHAVQFRTMVGGDNTNQTYEEDYFKKGDEIRIYCPVGHSTPDFSTGATGMYVYTYDKVNTGTTGPADPSSTSTDWSNWPYHFVPKETDGGFDWRFLQPTSIYYTFEAIHFPAREPFEENKVPTDQSIPSEKDEDGNFIEAKGLDAADMLIAHHRQTLNNVGQPVQLTFHHAFAMVEVEVKIPVSWNAKDGAFPPNALKRVYMHDMLLQYGINYSATIPNDGVRKVRVPADPEKPGQDKETGRKDVTMRLVSCLPRIDESTPIPEDAEEETETFQTYIFQGIVPEQNFMNLGHDFVFFEVQKYSSTKPVLYRFTVTNPQFTLKSSQILCLHLEIDEKTNPNNVVVVTANVKPWLDAVMTEDMELTPKT